MSDDADSAYSIRILLGRSRPSIATAAQTFETTLAIAIDGSF
jgi:hypothetical protein